MKKYQKEKCKRRLQKQVEESLTRKKETIEKGIQYYEKVETEKEL